MALKIQADNLICHIVGINNHLKDQLIASLSDPSLIIKDLDQITHQIRTQKDFIQLHKKVSRAKTPETKKKALQQLHGRWREQLHQKVTNLLTRHKQKSVILIGLSTYHRDHRIQVKINCSKKWFLSCSDDQCARQIIEYNLDEYRPHIVNGSFPIKYIDHAYLMTQRDRIRQVYLNLGYRLKGFQGLKHQIQKILEKQEKKEKAVEEPLPPHPQSGGRSRAPSQVSLGVASPEPTFSPVHSSVINDLLGGGETRPTQTNSMPWYVGSLASYQQEIVPVKHHRRRRGSSRGLVKALREGGITDRIVTYVQPWLAVLSAVPNISHLVSKGYQETNRGRRIPYIKERFEGAFEELRCPGWLYQIEWSGKPQELHKTVLQEKVKIRDRERIPNIKKYLAQQGVSFFPYAESG